MGFVVKPNLVKFFIVEFIVGFNKSRRIFAFCVSPGFIPLESKLSTVIPVTSNGSWDPRSKANSNFPESFFTNLTDRFIPSNFTQADPGLPAEPFSI